MSETYTTSQGDTWDIISLKVYGVEKYVDVLIGANWREQSRVFFPSGIELVVPIISTEEQNSRNLPPWKK